ncbi:MAG: PaaI family thioesterase [Alphaproteobacteria bacterium]|nr:PaaI family thioesterase [Alphaproteobacteria bacterium]
MREEIDGVPLLSKRMPVYIVEWGDGRFVLETTFGDDHLNRAGVVHGGLIAALLDMGLAGGSYADAPEPRKWYGMTVSMTVNFLHGVGPGQVHCEAGPSGGGNRTRHVEARLLNDAGDVVATASGVVKIIERPE